MHSACSLGCWGQDSKPWSIMWNPASLTISLQGSPIEYHFILLLSKSPYTIGLTLYNKNDKKYLYSLTRLLWRRHLGTGFICLIWRFPYSIYHQLRDVSLTWDDSRPTWRLPEYTQGILYLFTCTHLSSSGTQLLYAGCSLGNWCMENTPDTVCLADFKCKIVSVVIYLERATMPPESWQIGPRGNKKKKS